MFAFAALISNEEYAVYYKNPNNLVNINYAVEFNELKPRKCKIN